MATGKNFCNTRKRPRGFASWNPSGSTLEVLDAVNDVLDEYSANLPLTVRQIFYRLCGRNAIEKTEQGYGRLQEHLVRARRAGLIPFDAIRDDGFYRSTLNSWLSANEYINAIKLQSTDIETDRQLGQDRPAVIWCEARGMAPMLETVASRYGLPVMSSGGFDSLTTKHDMGLELSQVNGLVLHLGDYDPSGEAMFTALEEDVLAFARHYGGEPSLERIAVTPEQIDRYQLETAPPKATDKRSGFTDSRTVQLEAFAPDDLLELLKSAITSRIDMDAYVSALKHEADMREELARRLEAL